MFGIIRKMCGKKSTKRKTPINPLKSVKITEVLSTQNKAMGTKIIHRKNSHKDSEIFLDSLSNFSSGSSAESKSKELVHETYRDELEAAPYASGRASRLTGRASSFKLRNMKNIGSFKLDRSINFKIDDIKVRTYQMALKEIQVLSHIGRGMIAEVYLGVWRGVLVALKTLRTSNTHECSLTETTNQLFQEIGILSTLQHKNIVSFVGSSIGENHMMLVTEYLPDGELYDHLRSPQNRDYSLFDAISHARDISSAMKYVHNQQILQCDLKSSNVLMTSDKQYSTREKIVKLSDFGSAVNVNKADHTMGTVFNAAPELLSGKCLNSYKTDVYAFSMIMWELIARTDPYQYIPVICLPLVISNGRRPYLSKLKRERIPGEYIALMEQCWHPVPSCRPSFEEIHKTLEKLYKKIRSIYKDETCIEMRKNLKIYPEAETLPKRDMDRVDTMFKCFVKRQDEKKIAAKQHVPQQSQYSLRSQGNTTLDLDTFKQLVTNMEETKLNSFDDLQNIPSAKRLPTNSIKNEINGKDAVNSEQQQQDQQQLGKQQNCSSFELLTQDGVGQLCDDLKVQTINNRIDKWHLISALATLREKSMSTYSIVMAACEMYGKKNATDIDYSKAPVERQASWSVTKNDAGGGGGRINILAANGG